MALLRDKNEQLTRTNLDQAERIAALEAREENGSLFALKRDTAEDIARAIAANIGEAGARRQPAQPSRRRTPSRSPQRLWPIL